MTRALIYSMICIAAVVAAAILLWLDLRWGQAPGLMRLVGIVGLISVAGVMFRSGSEAWATRKQRAVSFEEAAPAGAKLVAKGLALNLRPTVTDQNGLTSRIEFAVQSLHRFDGRLWVAGLLGQKGKNRRAIALPVGAISYIIETQTGQFVAEDFESWLLQRSRGWQDAGAT